MALNKKEIRQVTRKIARQLRLSPRGRRLLEIVLEIIVCERHGGEELTAEFLIDVGTSPETQEILSTIGRREDRRPQGKERVTALTLLHAFSSASARQRLQSALYTYSASPSTVAFLIDYD